MVARKKRDLSQICKTPVYQTSTIDKPKPIEPFGPEVRFFRKNRTSQHKLLIPNARSPTRQFDGA
jgi:hypothetical protein